MIKYEAKVASGTYKDKEGNDKTQWISVGRVIERDGKLSLKLDVIPVGFDGWIKLFEPREKTQQTENQQPKIDLSGINDSIPF